MITKLMICSIKSTKSLTNIEHNYIKSRNTHECKSYLELTPLETMGEIDLESRY